MLIDSHAHLDAPYFRDKLPAVMERAQQAGVGQVVTIGVTPASTRNSIALAARYPGIFATAGYHPHWAGGATAERMAQMASHAHDPTVVALGEIGLDFYRLRSPRQAQIDLFHHMLDLAVAVGLPVIIHDRHAHDETYAILSQYRSRLAGGVIHCFSGDWSLARKYLAWGFYLSIPGTVTNPRAKNLRDVAARTPLTQLLLETDAPHLSPIPKKTRKNEPALMRHTALEVARLRQISLNELAEATTANVRRLYAMPSDT